MTTNYSGHEIKTRGKYQDMIQARFTSGAPEVLRVTGWQDVNGEAWARISFGGKVAGGMLCHPDRLEPVDWHVDHPEMPPVRPF